MGVMKSIYLDEDKEFVKALKEYLVESLIQNDCDTEVDEACSLSGLMYFYFMECEDAQNKLEQFILGYYGGRHGK